VFRVETEEVTLPNNGGQTSRHRLTLMTEKGLVHRTIIQHYRNDFNQLAHCNR
jgi:hypothetical protein